MKPINETYKEGVVVGKTFIASCTLALTIKDGSMSISVVLSDEAYDKFVEYCEKNNLAEFEFAAARMYIVPEHMNYLAFMEGKEGGVV